MSLEVTGPESGIVGFPRVSGDEPPSLLPRMRVFRFSPRERG